MSRRDVFIPPLIDANGNAVDVEIGISLVNSARSPIIGYTESEGIIEPSSLFAETAGTVVSLVPQSEIYGDSYYQINLVSSHRSSAYYVQIPDGVDQITLQELLGLDEG